MVRAERRCKERGDSAGAALSQASMELLRFGAEQFENFRRAYPFSLSLERRTTLTMAGRTVRRSFEVDTTASNKWRIFRCSST